MEPPHGPNLGLYRVTDLHVDLIEKYKQSKGLGEKKNKVHATFQVLYELLEKSPYETQAGLLHDLTIMVDLLCLESGLLSVRSSCELFKAFVVRKMGEITSQNTLQRVKQEILSGSQVVLHNLEIAHDKIAINAFPYIADGSTIGIFGESSCVLSVLKYASTRRRNLTVIIIATFTMRAEDATFLELARVLSSHNVNVTIMSEGALVSHIHSVSFFLLGADMLSKNGGLVNNIGTKNIAIIAKSYRKPLYVATETVKFSNVYMLTNDDIPKTGSRARYSIGNESKLVLTRMGIVFDDSTHDLTEPENISLIFTDEGVHTPESMAGSIVRALYS